jgi:hypothetical protein
MSAGHVLLHLLDIKCFHLKCRFVVCVCVYQESALHLSPMRYNLGARKNTSVLELAQS